MHSEDPFYVISPHVPSLPSWASPYPPDRASSGWAMLPFHQIAVVAEVHPSEGSESSVEPILLVVEVRRRLQMEAAEASGRLS